MSPENKRKKRKKATESRDPRGLNALKHGLHSLKATMKVLGNRAIDGRTKVGRALAQWRIAIINDLGGAQSVSTAQEQIVELAVKTNLLLYSVDAYLLQNGSLVNKRKRCLYPIVRERQVLADALARYLGQLGLERRCKPVPTRGEYLAERGQDMAGAK